MAKYTETNILELVLDENETQAAKELRGFTMTELYTLKMAWRKIDEIVEEEIELRRSGTHREPKL